MEHNRIIAIAAAIAAIVCMMIAVKSCADDAVSQRKNRSKTSYTDTEDTTYTAEARADVQPETEAQELDLFGRPVDTTADGAVEYDLFGQPVTTEPPQAGTLPEGEAASESVTEATDEGAVPEDGAGSEEDTKEGTTEPPRISGYNHNEYDDEGNVKPTLPPDFVIVVE